MLLRSRPDMVRCPYAVYHTPTFFEKEALTSGRSHRIGTRFTLCGTYTIAQSRPKKRGLGGDSHALMEPFEENTAVFWT